VTTWKFLASKGLVVHDGMDAAGSAPVSHELVISSLHAFRCTPQGDHSMSYVETLLIETLVSDVSASKVFSFPRIGLYVDGVLNAHRLDSMEEAERRWALPTEGAD
jgi:hypothetical protein